MPTEHDEMDSHAQQGKHRAPHGPNYRNQKGNRKAHKHKRPKAIRSRENPKVNNGDTRDPSPTQRSHRNNSQIPCITHLESKTSSCLFLYCLLSALVHPQKKINARIIIAPIQSGMKSKHAVSTVPFFSVPLAVTKFSPPRSDKRFTLQL